MFLIGYKMKYAHGPELNEGSGVPWPEVAVQALLRTKDELRRLWLEQSASSRASLEEESEVVRFVVEPLATPSVVRPAHEPRVVYVRLALHNEHGTVSVLPSAAQAIAAELAQAEADGKRAMRAVLVGADSIVDPRAVDVPGYELALLALVDAIHALTAAKLPFVWRTRGGIDGPVPHILAQALVDAGALATVELGVPTLDAELCTALEGHTGALPEHRLRFGAALASRAIHVRGLVDPLVPMLTDQQQSLE
ncbi:MAG TPA: hypothetical protein VGO62_19990, partial [Myxococcota bacterium]